MHAYLVTIFYSAREILAVFKVKPKIKHEKMLLE